jgi:hypothetical protein
MVARATRSNVRTAVESPAVKTKSRAKTYTVACKLQSGLYAHLFEFYETVEASPMGHRTIKLARRIEPGVVINGTAQSRDHGARLRDLVAGHAITKGVDAEFWDTFVEQHKDADYILNKLVIWWPENDSGESIGDYAKDGEKLLTGAEPLDPTMIEDAKGRFHMTDPRFKVGIPLHSNLSSGTYDGSEK